MSSILLWWTNIQFNIIVWLGNNSIQIVQQLGKYVFTLSSFIFVLYLGGVLLDIRGLGIMWNVHRCRCWYRVNHLVVIVHTGGWRGKVWSVFMI